MKTISLNNNPDKDEVFQQTTEILKQDGLLCIPCGGTYRIVADLTSVKAVLNLFQSKHRTQNTPTLVFVANPKMLSQVTTSLEPIAQTMIDLLWPGPLTILVNPTLDLPSKIIKRMTKANGKVGVRVPAGEIAQGVVQHFGGPLLVSSANRERKSGAYSPAQVRKNFLNTVDLFLDAGDLTASPPSTVVDIEAGEVRVLREGAFSTEDVLAAACI